MEKEKYNIIKYIAKILCNLVQIIYIYIYTHMIKK